MMEQPVIIVHPTESGASSLATETTRLGACETGRARHVPKGPLLGQQYYVTVCLG